MVNSLCRSASLYFSELAQTTPVSDPQEERRLIQRWQKHRDIVSRDTIVRSHLRFVVTVARKRSHDPDRLPDLIAAGNIGLLKALDKYDLKRKPPTRFLTYAGWWVQKEVADEDYATSSLVHVPTHRQKAQRKQAKAFQKALLEHGPEAAAVQTMNPGNPEGITYSIATHPGLPDFGDDCQPLMAIDTTSSNVFLRNAISQLPLREQTVLNLYFGMKDEPRNLVQIAAILGMSPERVRQIKISGTCQLKDALKEQSVEASCDAY